MSSPTKKPDPDGAPVPAAQQDVVLVQGRTEDKRGLRVIRAREGRLEAGEILPVEEGKPIHHDLVRLKPRPGMPWLCDVETQLRVPRPVSDELEQDGRAHRAGPAQVASAAYRANWDSIWQKRSAPGSSELN